MSDKRYFFPYGRSSEEEHGPVMVYIHRDGVSTPVSSLEGVFVSALDLRSTAHNPSMERSEMSQFETRNKGTFVDFTRQNSPTSWAARASEINHTLHGVETADQNS